MTTQITEYSKTDAALADLASRYKGVVFEVATTAGMQDARTARAELRNYRVDLEKVRVEIKAPALERCRLIDAEAKRITAALVDLEEPIDNLIKTEEKRKEREAMERVMAEQRRVDAIRANIEAIRQLPSSCVNRDSAHVAGVLAHAEAMTIGESYAELRVEAETVLRVTLAQLSVMLTGTKAQEAEGERIKAEREELARLRADQSRREEESRARIAEQERAAREASATEEAKLRAERQKIEDERRAAETERREAEEAAEAKRRAIERKENAILDAHALLATFKTRFGHLPEFAQVVAAIDLCAPKKARRAA